MNRHTKVTTNGGLNKGGVQDDCMRRTAGKAKEEGYSPDIDDDQVNSPSHYQSYIKDGIDCITAMQHAFGVEATAIFCKLNAFKYNWRASSKNGNEDIQKAIWYLNKYLELGGENL